MTKLNHAVGSRLEWRQPEIWRREHELSANGEIVGSLRFEKSCGTLATAEFGGIQWTFKRGGFWSPKVSVREAGSETDLAIFTPKWTGGGQLELSSGRRFTLRSVSFWGGEWAFDAENGDEVVSVHGPHGFVKHRGEASIGLCSSSLSELPLLLLLIWYLRLLMQEDAAGASVIAATG